MKWVLRIVLVLLLIVLVGGFITLRYAGSIIREVVQSEGSSALGVNTTLSSASLDLFGGHVNLSGLELASPAGYSAPKMFSLGSGDVRVSYGKLREDPIRISNITLDKLALVIEERGGKLNLQALTDEMAKRSEPQPTDAKRDQSKPVNLVIDELTITNSQVTLKLSLLPTEITVPIPSMTLKNIGTGEGSKNGAALGDVIALVSNELMGAAASSDKLPPEVQALLKGKFAEVGKQLTEQAMKKVGEVGQQVGKAVGDVVNDPSKLINDPGKALQGILGGDKKDAPATQPGAQQGGIDPGRALQGLLGGEKRD